MKKPFAIAAAFAGFAGLAAVPAAAQGFAGGNVSVEADSVSNVDYSPLQIGGSALFSVSPKLAVQGDVMAVSDIGESDLGVHLVFPASPTAAVGVFWNYQSLTNVDYNQFGIEAKAQLGSPDRPTTLEGFFSTEEDDRNYGITFQYAALSVTAPAGNALSVKGTIGKVSDQVSLRVISAGVSYEARPGFHAELSYTDVSGDFDRQSLAIGLNFDIRRGTVFARRSSSVLLHGI